MPVRRSFARVSGPLRALVAEDAGPRRKATAATLGHLGFLVHGTADAPGLAEAVRGFKPDVLLLDDQFGGSEDDASAMVADLMASFPGLRVIVMSSVAKAHEGWDAALGWGASEVLRKATMLRGQSLRKAIDGVMRD